MDEQIYAMLARVLSFLAVFLLILGGKFFFTAKKREDRRKDPALPLHVVAEESGFPNETTFLRNFKAQTGLTPTEWKTNQ